MTALSVTDEFQVDNHANPLAMENVPTNTSASQVLRDLLQTSDTSTYTATSATSVLADHMNQFSLDGGATYNRPEVSTRHKLPQHIPRPMGPYTATPIQPPLRRQQTGTYPAGPTSILNNASRMQTGASHHLADHGDMPDTISRIQTSAQVHMPPTNSGPTQPSTMYESLRVQRQDQPVTTSHIGIDHTYNPWPEHQLSSNMRLGSQSPNNSNPFIDATDDNNSHTTRNHTTFHQGNMPGNMIADHGHQNFRQNMMQHIQPQTTQPVLKIYAKLFELWSDRQEDNSISKLQYRQKELHRLIIKLQQIDEQGTDLPALPLLDLEPHEVLPFFL